MSDHDSHERRDLEDAEMRCHHWRTKALELLVRAEGAEKERDRLREALIELEENYTIDPGGTVLSHCGKCYSDDWLNGNICHATTCPFGALVQEVTTP